MARNRKNLGKQSAGKIAKHLDPALASTDKRSIPTQTSNENWYHENFRWSQRSMDHDYCGGWDWNLNAKEARLILQTLEEMSQKTWKEISQEVAGKKGRAKSHSQSIEEIADEARKRLPDLQVEAEELYRIRLGYSERLWGFRINGCFHILWFDRNHKIYAD